MGRPMDEGNAEPMAPRGCVQPDGSAASGPLEYGAGRDGLDTQPSSLPLQWPRRFPDFGLEGPESQDSMFGEFIAADNVQGTKYRGQPWRYLLFKTLENNVVKSLVGLATFFSFVGVVKDTDARATGNPLPEWLVITEHVLIAVFALELALRFYVERCDALRSLHNIADIVVVCTGVAEYLLVYSGVDSGLSKVKLLRLARVTKLMRMVYHVPFFVELRKLMYMISSCMKTLFWSFLVLGIVMTMWSIVAVELIHPRVLELSSLGHWSDCERCSRSFSTVFHANITFFQTIVAGDSWGRMAIPVIEAHPWSLFIFTGALLTLVFGVLNVIVAVVVDAFAEARAKDVFTRARELQWDEQQEKKVLSDIFRKVDADGNGTLDIEELKEGARKVQEFSHLLRVLDIDTRDLEEMFVMLDRDGSGDVCTHEFVEWMYRMKNTDAKTVSQFIKQKLTQIQEKVDEQESTFDSRLSDLAQFQSESLQKWQEQFLQSHLAEISNLLAESLQRLAECLQKSESLHRGTAKVNGSPGMLPMVRGPRRAAEPSVPPSSQREPLLLLLGGSETAPLVPQGGGELAVTCHPSLTAPCVDGDDVLARLPCADDADALARRSSRSRTAPADLGQPPLGAEAEDPAALAVGRRAPGDSRRSADNFRSAMVLASPQRRSCSRGRPGRRRPSLGPEAGRALQL